MLIASARVAVLLVVGASLSAQEGAFPEFRLGSLLPAVAGSVEETPPPAADKNPFKDHSFWKDTERKSGGTVFFRGAFTWFPQDRGKEVFTDTLGGTGQNDDNTGFGLGAGLDLDLGHELLFGNLLGEVFVEYARHSRKEVTQATSALLGGTNTSKVTVAELAVVIAPKVVWDFGRVRPWLIPVGVGFLVNSPPSNDTTYLDFGVHFGLGLEVTVLEPFSLGIDVRYTQGFGDSDTQTDYLSAGGYVGLSF